MTDSRLGVRIVELASKLLLGLGALTFLFGERALIEFAKWHFPPAKVVGILSGIALMMTGAIIGKWGKSGHPS